MPTQHTPGPWRQAGSAVVKGEEKIAITGDYSTDDVSSTHLANARLIAAAPELIKALADLHKAVTAVPAARWLHLDADTGEAIDAALEAAWSAIAKATSPQARQTG